MTAYAGIVSILGWWLFEVGVAGVGHPNALRSGQSLCANHSAYALPYTSATTTATA